MNNRTQTKNKTINKKTYNNSLDLSSTDRANLGNTMWQLLV